MEDNFKKYRFFVVVGISKRFGAYLVTVLKNNFKKWFLRSVFKNYFIIFVE